MTETKSKRRWFRFGLRTLFLLQAVLAIDWTVYQLNWIRQRHKFLNETQHHPIFSSEAPWSLRVFGERGVRGIVIQACADSGEPRRLFPEAMIFIM